VKLHIQRQIAVATALAAGLLSGCGGDAEPPQKLRAPAAESALGAETALDPDSPRAATVDSETTENTEPHIHDLQFEPQELTTGSDVRVLVDVNDPDGDTVWLRYAWLVDRKPLEGSTSRVSLRGFEKGSRVEVEVTARDGKGGFHTSRLATEVSNAAPVLGRVNVHASESLTSGEPVLLQPEATDADGDAVSFRYEWRVNGVLQAADGDRFDTAQLDRGDALQATVYASDGSHESEGRELPPLSVGNAAPRILSQPGEDFGSGDSFYQVRAEDPDGNGALRFSLEGAPEGMRIDPESGAVRWRPSPDQVGKHTLAVIVTDTQGGSSRQAIEVNVGDPSASAAPPAARNR